MSGVPGICGKGSIFVLPLLHSNPSDVHYSHSTLDGISSANSSRGLLPYRPLCKVSTGSYQIRYEIWNLEPLPDSHNNTMSLDLKGNHLFLDRCGAVISQSSPAHKRYCISAWQSVAGGCGLLTIAMKGRYG
jgi:hypothetical protein